MELNKRPFSAPIFVPYEENLLKLELKEEAVFSTCQRSFRMWAHLKILPDTYVSRSCYEKEIEKWKASVAPALFRPGAVQFFGEEERIVARWSVHLGHIVIIKKGKLMWQNEL